MGAEAVEAYGSEEREGDSGEGGYGEDRAAENSKVGVTDDGCFFKR